MAKRRRKNQRKGAMPRMIGILIVAIGLLLGGDNLWGEIRSFLQNSTVNYASQSELVNLVFDGENQVVYVDDGLSTFTAEELSLDNGAWQTFSDLDTHNRVGVANAMLHKSLMPTEDREPLHVNPTGWKNKQFIDSIGNEQWLYNRAHLIGFQFTGENNNLKNLMTATRSLNNPGMLYFENMIAAYLRDTGNHVRYRVEPIFKENELVARGVQMMARSIEDDEIDFNVYIFNVEEGIKINYEDGSSQVVQ